MEGVTLVFFRMLLLFLDICIFKVKQVQTQIPPFQKNEAPHLQVWLLKSALAKVQFYLSILV